MWKEKKIEILDTRYGFLNDNACNNMHTCVTKSWSSLFPPCYFLFLNAFICKISALGTSYPHTFILHLLAFPSYFSLHILVWKLSFKSLHKMTNNEGQKFITISFQRISKFWKESLWKWERIITMQRHPLCIVKNA
jgi:hypothetical protein